jgi:L-arabinose isomerase
MDFTQAALITRLQLLCHGRGRAKVEVHPLSIGGKEDPVRLVFDAPAGPAINVAIIDLGNRDFAEIAGVELVVAVGIAYLA